MKEKIKICMRNKPTRENIIKITENKIELVEKKIDLALEKYTVSHIFSFDHIFGSSHKNIDLYETLIKDWVEGESDKRKLICFAFGETGSGKTHTIIGSKINSEVEPGILPISLNKILQTYGKVNVSAFEIYNNKLFDLLNKRNPVICREDENKNFKIIGMMDIKINYKGDLDDIINSIKNMRICGETNANNNSSRSHAIIRITFDKNGNQNDLYFVDLAGSEKASESIFKDRKLFRENAEINKSLLSLKECIRCLYFKKKYIPYRYTKLTSILREAFEDKCDTIMISNISSCENSIKSTLNTLRYSAFVKNMEKKTTIDKKRISSENTPRNIIKSSKYQREKTELVKNFREFCYNLSDISGKGIFILNDIREDKETNKHESIKKIKKLICKNQRVIENFSRIIG